jgi:quercetin dioxygenase-like cupin family protein
MAASNATRAGVWTAVGCGTGDAVTTGRAVTTGAAVVTGDVVTTGAAVGTGASVTTTGAVGRGVGVGFLFLAASDTFTRSSITETPSESTAPPEYTAAGDAVIAACTTSNGGAIGVATRGAEVQARLAANTAAIDQRMTAASVGLLAHRARASKRAPDHSDRRTRLNKKRPRVVAFDRELMPALTPERRAYRRRMDVQLDRQSAPPHAQQIEKRIRDEARDVYGWSNGPGDRYPQHAHSYNKLLYCTSGSIDFTLSDGRTLSLHAGDRMLLPAGTSHGAIVGPEGCACVEGKV